MAWEYWSRHGVKDYMFAVNKDKKLVLYVQVGGDAIYHKDWIEQDYTWYDGCFKQGSHHYYQLKVCEARRYLRTQGYKVNFLPVDQEHRYVR